MGMLTDNASVTTVEHLAYPHWSEECPTFVMVCVESAILFTYLLEFNFYHYSPLVETKFILCQHSAWSYYQMNAPGGSATSCCPMNVIAVYILLLHSWADDI